MKKLSTKEILLLVLLVFLVSGALYYTYYFRPYQEKMLDLETNIITSTQRLITLQNEQQSIIEDTAKLNNELIGAQDDLEDIPVGVDEPRILVYIDEALTGLATESSIRFTPETVKTEYFQINLVLISFRTDYEGLKNILLNIQNAPFRNRIILLDATYQNTDSILGPDMLAPSNPVEDIVAPDTDTEEAPDMYLSIQLTMECFSLQGEVTDADYPFLFGPYQNDNPFIKYVSPAGTTN